MQITVDGPTDDRLDVFLAGRLDEMTRSRVQALLKSGHILLNGREARPKSSLVPGDSITIDIPEPTPSSVEPQDIPLSVLHEDEHLIVIDKPAGLVVHPAAGNPDGTLVNALLHHCKGQLAGIGGVERPGIVHRLDKDTSGCLVAAKTDQAHQSLVSQFAARQITKHYLAVSEKTPKEAGGTIFTHLGRHPVHRQKMAVVNPGSGRPAITDYQLLAGFDDGVALLLCHLHTGRTHQIRVHLKHIGCPLLGDVIYASPSRQPRHPGRLMLHAWRLGFTHPATRNILTCEAPLPAAFDPFLPDPSLLDPFRSSEH